MTLVETLVALAIFGLVAGVFLAGLYISSKSVMVSQERVAAESLAKSQMEYIKSQDYDDANDPPIYDVDTSLPLEGYTISVAAERIDLNPDEPGDDGLQKITVTVNHDGDEILTLEDYKVDR